MAAWAFRKKIKTLTRSPSFHLILMSTLTWITEKQLEREINNNGDKFRWKKNMKIK